MEPDLAAHPKKSEDPPGEPPPRFPDGPSGLTGGPSQTRNRNEPTAASLAPVTAPAAAGPDTGIELEAQASNRAAFAQRPNKGKLKQKAPQQANQQKREKHRLRVLKLAEQKGAATTAATSSAGGEDDEDDDDDGECSMSEHGESDSEAGDASERDTGKSPPAQPAASGTKPANIPKKNTSAASRTNPSPGHGGGASSGRPSNPLSRPLTQRHRCAVASPGLSQPLTVTTLLARHRPEQKGLRRLPRPPRRRQRARRP